MAKAPAPFPSPADSARPPAPKSGRRGAVWAVVASLAAGIVVVGIRGRGPSGPPAKGANVLLVTIDTLRADHVGCYGYARAATPTLDALAAGGARFRTAIAHVPLTGPSHASILTGRTPLGHGMRDNGGFVLPPSVPTAAETFQQAGYRTAAFVSGFPLSSRFGHDRGFGTYDDHLARGNDPRRPAYVERSADRTTDAAMAWLDASKGSKAPFFLWVHYYDPHAPYEPPAAFAASAASPYDGEIAFVDSQIARLLHRVGEGRSTLPTLVLVTADHGESLGEHGEDTHGIFIYDSTLRVPWIVAGVGVPEGRVVDTIARGIDVAPTLLDYAGLGLPGMEGRSLRPAIDGKTLADAPAYAESMHPQLQYGWAPLHAWRTKHFKLIEAPRPELYDLEADGGETRDRSKEDPLRLDAMRGRLREVMATTTPVAVQAIDAETAERLGALGYLGAGGGKAAPPTGKDPKDGIGLATRLGRNGMTVARTEPDKAIRELTRLLAEDQGMLVALRTRAVAYETLGQYEGAIQDLRALEKQGALTAEDSVVLGDNLRMAGRLREAMEVLQGTAGKNPKFAQPLLSLAAVFVQEKKMREAAATFEKVLAISPDHLEALRGLGDLGLMDGDLGRAETRYGRILEVDPKDTGAMTKMGVVRMRQGRGAEALDLFQKAIEREPKNGEALLYLAGALAASGRAADALPYFERALAAGQRSSMLLNGMALARLEVGDRAGAAASFRESLRLDPHQPDVAKALSDLGGPG